jgi:hypothetical protein
MPPPCWCVIAFRRLGIFFREEGDGGQVEVQIRRRLLERRTMAVSRQARRGPLPL